MNTKVCFRNYIKPQRTLRNAKDTAFTPRCDRLAAYRMLTAFTASCGKGQHRMVLAPRGYVEESQPFSEEILLVKKFSEGILWIGVQNSKLKTQNL